MKVYLALAALALAGCASTPRDPALDAYARSQSLQEERARESGQRMQDEFNALTGNAY